MSRFPSGIVRQTLPPLRVAILNPDGTRSHVAELPDPREAYIACLRFRAGITAVPIDNDESLERRSRRRDLRIAMAALRRLKGGQR